jgi:hypothetical protein
MYGSTFSRHQHQLGVGGQLHVSGKEPPQYPLDRWLGGLQSSSGRHGEVKILDPLILTSLIDIFHFRKNWH